MKQQSKIISWVIIIISLGLVAHYAGLLSFVGGPASYQHTAFGQNWTITSNWATGSQLNTPSAGRGCPIVTTDTSTNTSISMTSSTSNYATDCSTLYRLDTSISLDNFDFTKYQTVVIHRSGTARILWGDWGQYARTSIDTITSATGSETPGPAGFPQRRTSTSLSIGDVTIVNTGNGMYTLYSNPESPNGFLISNPKNYVFKTNMQTYSDTNMGQSLSITGIDLTPLPGVVIPPVTPPTSDNRTLYWIIGIVLALLLVLWHFNNKH